MMNVVYMDGVEIGKIAETEITPIAVEDKFTKKVWKESLSTTFTFTVNRKKLITTLFGISNNYLKMHGQPMLRRWIQ